MSNKLIERIAYVSLICLVIYMVGDTENRWENLANKATNVLTGKTDGQSPNLDPYVEKKTVSRGWNEKIRKQYFENCLNMSRTGSGWENREYEVQKPFRIRCHCVVETFESNVDLTGLDEISIREHLTRFAHGETWEKLMNRCNTEAYAH